MSELPGELTYRISYSEWLQWIVARSDAVPPSRRVRLAAAWNWTWYFVIVIGLAAGLSSTAELATGAGLQVPIFILAVVLISGVLALQETAGRKLRSTALRAQFEASIYGSAEIRLTLDEHAASIRHGGMLYRIPWESVVAIYRSRSIIVIACDPGLGGIVVPVRALPDPNAPEAFEAGLKARAAAAGGAPG